MASEQPKRPKKFIPEPFDYHQEIELEIDALTNLGQGLGRIDNWVVMVPFALPGERVRARIYRNSKNFSEADLVEVLRPSPDRIEPPCPLFGQCGGCQYQNFNYEAQLKVKAKQVEELLWHMARVKHEAQPTIASPRQYGYRSKITPHFSKPREDRPLRIGFLQAGANRFYIDVEKCLLASDAMNETLATKRSEIMEKASQGFYKKGATLLIREHLDGIATDPKEIIREQVGTVAFSFPAGEFFQNNPSILERFASYVSGQAAGGQARFLVDAYCGSGLFCLSAAPKFEKAVGIEVSEQSIQYAIKNAEANGIENASFLLGDAASIFENVDFPGEAAAVIIDPPRRGSSEEFLAQLVAFGPSRIVYVSCNPATQMRDLKSLLENGYAIEEAQPFDLFPQTKHLECVITLSREPAGP